MKKLSHYLFLFFLSANAYADTKLSPAWSSSAEFKNPESVIYDPVTKHLFVSNVNGEPLAADGNGFISQMSPEGVMAKSKWLVGLDAPKGLALKGNLLYVSDIDQLVVIDIEQERIIKRYAAENAKFLNDVAVDHQGNVYVSDMLTNRIYRLANDELTVWVDDDMLNSPNGLLVEHGKLVVASWGKMTDGFATDVPGHLLAIDLVTKQLQDLGDGKPVGNFYRTNADTARNDSTHFSR